MIPHSKNLKRGSNKPYLQTDSQVWNIWESLATKDKSTAHWGAYTEILKQIYSGLSSKFLPKKKKKKYNSQCDKDIWLWIIFIKTFSWLQNFLEDQSLTIKSSIIPLPSQRRTVTVKFHVCLWRFVPSKRVYISLYHLFIYLFFPERISCYTYWSSEFF